jgi:hypothetical protein
LEVTEVPTSPAGLRGKRPPMLQEECIPKRFGARAPLFVVKEVEVQKKKKKEMIR